MPVEIDKVGPPPLEITPPAGGTDIIGHSLDLTVQRAVKRPHKMRALRNLIAPDSNRLIGKHATFNASDRERQSFLAHGALAEDAVETGGDAVPAGTEIVAKGGASAKGK